jgi:hypothetical protein
MTAQPSVGSVAVLAPADSTLACALLWIRSLLVFGRLAVRSTVFAVVGVLSSAFMPIANRQTDLLGSSQRPSSR